MLCVAVKADVSAVAAAVAADADEKKLKTSSSLASSVSWSSAAAAAAASDVIRYQSSASEAKHQRTSSLDDSRLTNVSLTLQFVFTT